MSAREELIGALAEHACCFTEEDAKRMVDAFAHELAEQIRTAMNGDDPDNMWVVTAYDAATLVDPQARTKEPR